MPPVREPVAAKLARGETRPSRLSSDAPQPKQVPPRMPHGLDDRSKRVWRRTLAAMEGTGVILAPDADTLRVYCDIVVRYETVIGQLMRSTPLLAVSRRRGEVVKNPLSSIARDLAEQHRLYARELGLTPSARASLHVDMAGRHADMDDILGPPPRLRAV